MGMHTQKRWPTTHRPDDFSPSQNFLFFICRPIVSCAITNGFLVLTPCSSKHILKYNYRLSHVQLQIRLCFLNEIDAALPAPCTAISILQLPLSPTGRHLSKKYAERLGRVRPPTYVRIHPFSIKPANRKLYKMWAISFLHL